MKYAPYPRMRNYKKRCEIRTQRAELCKQFDIKRAAAVELESDEEYEKFLDDCDRDYFPMIRYLEALEESLEYPETKNEWFCNIVKEKGVGCHRISANQVHYFSRYFENGHGKGDSNSYCRAAGYFCELASSGRGGYLVIKEIKSPQ